jgi:NADPH2:quinone reductase
MKSIGVIFPEPGRACLESFDLPDPGPGQVLLEAEFSSLSPGTERGLMTAASFRPFPINIGYSFAGRVVAAGRGADRFKVGDAVVTTGRHASFILADERFCTPAPEGVDLEQASFFNLAHTALYGVRRAQIELGEPVVVLGQGLVGLLAAKLAQLAGALPVIGVDLDEQRLALSRRLGIPVVVNGADADRLGAVLAGLDGGGPAAIIEVTGSRQAVETALDMVRQRGRIVMLSTYHGDGTIDFNSKPWSLDQTQVEMPSWPPSLAPGGRRYFGPGVWSSDEDVRVFLDLLRYGALDLAPLITHRFTPDQAPAAYELVLNQDRSLVGGVICWRS